MIALLAFANLGIHMTQIHRHIHKLFRLLYNIPKKEREKESQRPAHTIASQKRTDLGLRNQPIQRIAHPLQILPRVRIRIARNFDVAIPPRLLLHDTSVLGRVGRPPRASEQLDSMHRRIVWQREVIDSYDDGALGSGRVVLTLIVRRPGVYRRLF